MHTLGQLLALLMEVVVELFQAAIADGVHNAMHARLRIRAGYLRAEKAPPLHNARLVNIEALLDHIQLDEPLVLRLRVRDRI